MDCLTFHWWEVSRDPPKWVRMKGADLAAQADRVLAVCGGLGAAWEGIAADEADPDTIRRFRAVIRGPLDQGLPGMC